MLPISYFNTSCRTLLAFSHPAIKVTGGKIGEGGKRRQKKDSRELEIHEENKLKS